MLQEIRARAGGWGKVVAQRAFGPDGADDRLEHSLGAVGFALSTAIIPGRPGRPSQGCCLTMPLLAKAEYLVREFAERRE